jgi:hypothetical protein
VIFQAMLRRSASTACLAQRIRCQGADIRRKERERLADKTRLDTGLKQAVDLDEQVAEEAVIKGSVNAGKFWTQLGEGKRGESKRGQVKSKRERAD